MIGIFDSGKGGLASFYTVREALPREDIVYLADRKNAPYGTKSKEVLIKLVTSDIKRLIDLGCRKILIACCTASTVYPYLDREARAASVPIIAPAARAVAGGRVAVIATERTVRSRAFSRAIKENSPETEVFEIAAGELVSLVEEGGVDGCLTPVQSRTVMRIRDKILAVRPDTLILGCTHFSHLEESFAGELYGIKIVSAAREGARELIRLALPEVLEGGRCRYTE